MRNSHGPRGEDNPPGLLSWTGRAFTLAPEALLNALHLGTAFLQRLQMRQDELASSGAQDSADVISYTTIHAGIMAWRCSLNIVLGFYEIDFEIR
ncbi:hypothetical protein GCM10011491_35400 [Brucella endophytica]|uniref:Uncharacterized protein n=1 Tax=Brucella endophytica TaxID=1963359 RepID=A0A916WIH7_9HYPH|nr:hypothetical protein [Brucella endophytica]GGB04202.1 hypothetical protein GCM10011491_35400 [Brucella endophytica]